MKFIITSLLDGLVRTPYSISVVSLGNMEQHHETHIYNSFSLRPYQFLECIQSFHAPFQGFTFSHEMENDLGVNNSNDQPCEVPLH